MKKDLLVLVWIFTLASIYSVNAQELSGFDCGTKGYALYAKEDYKAAAPYFLKGAELGDPMSQYCLGIYYMDGLIVQQDEKRGLSLIKDAASKNFHAAINTLAHIYINGYGVAVDLNQARYWLNYAIENNPSGDEDTLLAGVDFISTLEKKGTAEAKFNIGMCYLNGMFQIGVNLKQALIYLTKAANEGYTQAQHNLGYLYGSTDYGITNYTEALKWYKKAAESNCAESQYNLYLHYLNGIGVERNPIEAFSWLVLAARGGNTAANNIIEATADKISKQSNQ